MKIYIITLFVTLSVTGITYSQDGETTSILNIYRPKESTMSGGKGLEVKVFLDDKEICRLLTNTKLTYKLHSTGSKKLKCVAEFAGSGIGSPYVETIDFQNGKTRDIEISVGSLSGVKGEVLDAKKVKKVSSVKYSDSLVLEEK